MPVKNAAFFLEECLDSILKQEEANFELIARDWPYYILDWRTLQRYWQCNDFYSSHVVGL